MNHNNTTNLQQALFKIAIVLLFFPIMQSILNFANIAPLGGYEETLSYQPITKETWFNNEFQDKTEQYLKANFGFRNWAVRLNHQYAYSFFSQSKTEAVVIGQEGYLFDKDYVMEHNGEFKVDAAHIKEKMRRWKQVQDTLQKIGKHLLVVIGPNKADYFHEYLPKERQIPRENLETNYGWYSQEMKNRGINHIDANKWFQEMKQNTPYPLFPQTGIHFSFYGAALFADTIIKNIEQGLRKDLPNFEWSEVAWNDLPQEEDDDLADALNLMVSLPAYKLPYPKIFVKEEGKYKPRALTIGDSFFWRFVNWGGLDKIYNQGQFWYYNKDAHPGNRPVKNLDFEQEIQKAEVICLVMASVNFWRFGFGFDDQLYEYFFSEEAKKKKSNDREAIIQAKMQEARQNPEWFAYIQKKAKETGKTVDEIVREEATFVVDQELNKE